MHAVAFQRGLNFKHEEMKSFTKAGQFVNFTVWPAFYLHENGPLLSKAIVQGTNQAQQERQEQTSAQRMPTSGSHVKIDTQKTVHDGRRDDRFVEPLPVKTPRGHWEGHDARYRNVGQRDHSPDSVDNYYKKSSSKPSKSLYVSYSSQNPPPREGYQQQNLQMHGQPAIPSALYKNKAYPSSAQPKRDSREHSHYRHDNHFREMGQGERYSGAYSNETYQYAPPKTQYKSHGNWSASRTYHNGSHVYRSTEL
jgi:hypothetical protein